MPNILETITDGVVVYDKDWRFTFINQRGADIVSKTAINPTSQVREKPVTKEELIGKTLWDVYPGAIGRNFYVELNRAIATQTPIHLQEYYPHLKIWLDVRAYPTPEGLVVLYQDITGRKATCEELKPMQEHIELTKLCSQLELQTAKRHRAEEALRITNVQLANILETIADGFFALDRQWRFTYVNRKAEQTLQKNQSELLGKNIWELNLEAISVTAYNQYNCAYESGLAIQFEDFCAHLNRWHQINIYPSDIGLSIYFQDITKRKQIEEECNQLLKREQQARARAELAEQRCSFLAEAGNVLASSLEYETTLDSVAQLSVPFLADYCLVHKVEENGQLRQVAAVHRDCEKQELVNEIGRLYPTFLQSSTSLTAQVLRTGEPRLLHDYNTITTQFETQDNKFRQICEELKPQSALIVPLVARKQILGVISLMVADSDRSYDVCDLTLAIDLAQRAAVAIDNAQLYSTAQESNRLKDEFLTTLSHELRTPLNAILGWAQILQRRELDEPTVKQALSTIERKAKEQVKIIYDLIDMSRIVTGMLRLNPVWLELNSVVEETVNSLSLAAEAKSISVDYQFEPLEGVLRGDPKYIRQIMWNLLANAIKFTPKYGQVQVKLKRVQNSAQIQITDTGEGIEPSFIPHIFDSFRQGDSSTTRHHGGLGLGLALVRHLVELHGGTISVKSKGEGLGTTFIVLLPLTHSADF